MLNLLIDYGRAHNSQTAGGGLFKVRLVDIDVPDESGGVEPAVIKELLDRLARREPRMSKVVEMHCFGGLTFFEIAEALNVAEKTAKRDWQMARAWLRGKLRHKNSYGQRRLDPD